MSPDYAGADVVLVNTCGFLDSAKEESLAAIGEAIAENGRVIVTGCMGNEAETIRARFPDVLAVTGAHQYEAVVEAVHEAAPFDGPLFRPDPQALDDAGGIKLTRATMAISRFPRAATTPARSASSPTCAASLPAAASMPCCARLKSWWRRAPANCW
jgi:hypothetical protein